MQLEHLLFEELSKLTTSLSQSQREDIHIGLVSDIAMLPIRVARGEDVSLITKSIKAEIAMLNNTASMNNLEAVKQMWINIIIQLLNTLVVVL
jgi:hypothetical protein